MYIKMFKTNLHFNKKDQIDNDFFYIYNKKSCAPSVETVFNCAVPKHATVCILIFLTA